MRESSSCWQHQQSRGSPACHYRFPPHLRSPRGQTEPAHQETRAAPPSLPEAAAVAADAGKPPPPPPPASSELASDISAAVLADNVLPASRCVARGQTAGLRPKGSGGSSPPVLEAFSSNPSVSRCNVLSNPFLESFSSNRSVSSFKFF